MEVEHLFVEPAPSAITTGTARTAPAVTTVAVLAAVAVIGALLWSLGGADDEATAPTSTSLPATTTTVLSSSAEHETTAPDRPTTDPTPLEAREAGVPPLLGHTTGLSLLITIPGGLQRLDLDTGERETFRATGRAVLVADDHLVLWDPKSGEVTALPLGDLDGVATVLGVTANDPVGAGPDGAVWSLEADGGYRRRLDGGLVVNDDTLVLVQTCTGPAVCELGWLDRRTWEPVDRPLPDGPLAADGPALLVGRLLVTVGPDGVSMLDVDCGRRLQVSMGAWLLSSSPNRRYVASPGPRTVTVHDLDTLVSYRLDLVAGGDVLFVPSELFGPSAPAATSDGSTAEAVGGD